MLSFDAIPFLLNCILDKNAFSASRRLILLKCAFLVANETGQIDLIDFVSEDPLIGMLIEMALVKLML